MRQKITGRRLGAGLLVLALGGAFVLSRGWSAAEPKAASPAPGPAPLAVRTAPVDVVDGYLSRRVYSGELRARRRADLAFEVPGRVLEVTVDEGDRVAAGEPLARLENERIEADLATLRAQRDRAAARLTELENGPRRQTVEAARTEVRRLEEELELAIQRHDRRVKLVAGEFVTADELDVTGTAVETSGAALEGARQRLDELEEGTREEAVLQQRAAVAELEARIRRAEVDRDDRVLLAPFPGVVLRRDLDEGAVVDAGRSVLELQEADALEARVGVPVARAADLESGQEVELEVRGETITARVRAVLPRLDGATRTADVVVELASEDARRFVSGEVARLALEEYVEEEGTWIPTSALVRGARGLWAAFALVPDADTEGTWLVERRELEILATTGERALVRGTLRPGDRLAVEGVHRIVPGQRVRPEDLPNAGIER